MRRLWSWLPIPVLTLILSGGAAAADSADLILTSGVTLTGDLIQGGMVKGQAAIGTAISLDGRPVRVDDQGRFVFGFGRDAKESILTITSSSGISEVRRLTVKSRDYDIQRIDGLPQKMVTPDPAVTARIQREQAQIAAVRKTDTAADWYLGGFIRPAKGRISGVYGSQRILNGEPRAPHYGLDIAAPVGTPVIAPAAGVVVLAEPDHYSTGRTVLIDHGHGIFSALIHMHSIAVKVGQQVKAGDPVGTIGATGRATGPHLDWRVNWFDIRLDPALLLATPD